MADEPAAPVAEEPTTDTPEEVESGPQDETPAQEATPTTDYEGRYKELQATYTQSQQFLSALQGNLGPDVQTQAFEQLGYELPQEEPADEYVDEEDRISRLEQHIAERDAAEQANTYQQQETDWLAENIDSLEKKEGITLSDHAVGLVVPAALSNRNPDGSPDLEGAYAAYKEALKADRSQYLESKRAPEIAAGGAGDEKIDTSDDNARQDAMRRIMDAEIAE